MNTKLPLDVRYKELIKKNIAETRESSPHLNPNDRWYCAIKDKNEWPEFTPKRIDQSTYRQSGLSSWLRLNVTEAL